MFDAVLAQPPTTLKTYHDIAVLAFKVSAPENATTAPVTAKFQITRAVFEAVEGGGSADVKARPATTRSAGTRRWGR